MPVPTPFDLKVTPEAKARLTAFLRAITEYEPTLVLIKGRGNNETEERWSYAAYGPDNIKALAPEFEAKDRSLLYAFEGFTVASPQFQFLFELVGNTIGVRNSHLVVLPRVAGT